MWIASFYTEIFISMKTFLGEIKITDTFFRSFESQEGTHM